MLGTLGAEQHSVVGTGEVGKAQWLHHAGLSAEMLTAAPPILRTALIYVEVSTSPYEGVDLFDGRSRTAGQPARS